MKGDCEGFGARALAAVLAGVALLAVPSLSAQSDPERSATSPAGEADSAAIATLAAWGGSGVAVPARPRRRLLRPSGGGGHLSAVQPQDEPRVRAGYPHEPLPSRRRRTLGRGAQRLSACRGLDQPSAHPQPCRLASGDPRLRPRGPDGTLPPGAHAHGTARLPVDRRALARRARDAVDRAGGDRRPLLQAVRRRGGRAGALLERRGRPELGAGGAPRSARHLQRSDLPGPGSQGGRGGCPLRLCGGTLRRSHDLEGRGVTLASGAATRDRAEEARCR